MLCLPPPSVQLPRYARCLTSISPHAPLPRSGSVLPPIFALNGVRDQEWPLAAEVAVVNGGFEGQRCLKRRRLAAVVAGNPVAFSDARQTGVFWHGRSPASHSIGGWLGWVTKPHIVFV